MLLFQNGTVIVDSLFQFVSFFGVHLFVFHGEIDTHNMQGFVDQREHVFQLIGQFFRENNVLVVSAGDSFRDVQGGIGNAFDFRNDLKHSPDSLGVFCGKLRFGNFGQVIGDFDFDFVAFVFHFYQIIELFRKIFRRYFEAFCHFVKHILGVFSI